MKKSAVIDGSFRYHLMRGWTVELPPLLFVMLNPSTADADKDDPTIRKCVGFATRLGFGSVEVVNLFAYRATNPADLAGNGWQHGPLNAYHVIGAALRVHACRGKVVCAWGAHARGRAEAPALLNTLTREGITPCALRLLHDGTPAHPLMLPYSCRLQEVPA